jgi:class 3 adenylate cyclase/pimeloyl-ACP methyl ester carboxylesterase
VKVPPIKYAHSGDSSIAFQVVGDSDTDLVVVNGPASNLELIWQERSTADTFLQIASFTRLLLFDRRGTGLSDPLARPPTLEQQMDDLTAVIEAAEFERPVLFGASDLGLCALYAATYPERVGALILSGVAPKGGLMMTEHTRRLYIDAIENHWGDGTLLELYAPSRADDPVFREWWGRMQRSAVSPGMARQLMAMIAETDLTGVLPTIRVPTVVIHYRGDRVVPVELGRQVAEMIPGATFREYPGEDNYAWSDMQGLADLQEFLTGSRPEQLVEDRVLATVMFTDIVDSTGHAARLGDSAWRTLLGRHHDLVREQLARWRGSEVKTIGDSFLATFDGPARAVRCAQAISRMLPELGLQVRIGVHTGECELLPNDVSGIAVHIAARIEADAQAGEVLVSSTVKDLVVGSGLQFADRGEHELRGIPGRWRLYAVTD